VGPVGRGAPRGGLHCNFSVGGVLLRQKKRLAGIGRDRLCQPRPVRNLESRRWLPRNDCDTITNKPLDSLETMLYFPLSPRTSHFRLLVLHAGKSDDQVSCDIVRDDLDGSQLRKFEALSYTWEIYTLALQSYSKAKSFGLRRI
jgi:hypothetical protein